MESREKKFNTYFKKSKEWLKMKLICYILVELNICAIYHYINMILH
jgi:hypothetical protein